MSALSDKRALIVGAGGLGSPAALLLARSGIGHLTLIDDDEVELSNLQRQILFTEADLGRPKAEVARAALLRDVDETPNRAISIEARVERLESHNATRLISAHDVVLDGADNFPTKFLLSDVAMRTAVPLVHAGVLRFAGQLLPIVRGGPCLRCLFEQEPAPEDAPSCAQAGVLGAAVGVIGCVQASLALALLRGESVQPTLRTIDLKDGRARQVTITPRADCPVCSDVRLDITQEHCPMTYVRTKLKLESLGQGEVLDVLLAGDEPLRNVPRSLREDGHRVREIRDLSETKHLVRVEKV